MPGSIDMAKAFGYDTIMTDRYMSTGESAL